MPHPFPIELRIQKLSHLAGLVQDPNSPIASYAAAVQALLVAAQKQGLC